MDSVDKLQGIKEAFDVYARAFLCLLLILKLLCIA